MIFATPSLIVNMFCLNLHALLLHNAGTHVPAISGSAHLLLALPCVRADFWLDQLISRVILGSRDHPSERMVFRSDRFDDPCLNLAPKTYDDCSCYGLAPLPISLKNPQGIGPEALLGVGDMNFHGPSLLILGFARLDQLRASSSRVLHV